MGPATLKYLKIVLINISVFLLLLTPVELVWRLYLHQNIKHSLNILADTHISYDVSSLYEVADRRIWYTRDKNGFRGSYGDMSDIEMIVMGGSTTDQRYIDDSETWDHVLREKLSAAYRRDVVIVNAGVDGQSTYGHLKDFDLWFSQLHDIRPRYILFYVGINDFYADPGYSYDDLNYSTSSRLQEFFRGSPVYHLYRVTAGLVRAKNARLAYGGAKIVKADSLTQTTLPLISDPLLYKELMARRLDGYMKRLTLLAARTRQLGAEPVFVTQRFYSYWKEKKGQIVGIAAVSLYDGVQYNGVDMYYMNRLLNQTTMSTCRAIEGVCLDLASDVEFGPEDFYDLFHNTPAGTRKIGVYLHEKLRGSFNAH